MDKILNKVGSYWFSNKANKEISSVGDDINSLSTSIEGGAKWFVNKLKVSLPISVNSHAASVSLLNGTNFAEWKEQVEFNLGVLDLDLALLFEKPVALTDESSADDVSFHQAWERSNRLSIMFLRMTIANNIKTTLPQTDNAKEYMENIADRFRTADKSLAQKKLMSDLTSMRFDGKMQKALQELLKEYDMPVGIFPRDATNYEFNEETGKLTVFIPSICEVGYKDSSVLRFSTTVTGYLEKGKLADIEGMKTKVMVWVKVTSITTQGPKVHFSTGLKKTRSREAYEVLRDGFIIDKF